MFSSSTRGSRGLLGALNYASRHGGQRQRSFSTSHPSSFFFNGKPPPPTASKLLSELNDARQQHRLDVVGKLYPQFVKTARAEAIASETGGEPSTSRGKPPVFEHARLRVLFRFVASTSRFDLLLRMFNDLHTLGIEPGRVDHHLLLQGMCRARKMDKAVKWIESMRETYGVRPYVQDWNVIVSGFRRARQFGKVRETIDRMRANGQRPDVYTYNTAISAAFDADDVDEVRRLVLEMQDEGIESDAWTETALLSGFVEKAELASAKIVQKRLARIVKEEMVGRPSVDHDMAVINALIGYACASEGVKAGVETANRYRDQGFLLDEWTLNTLIKHGGTQVDTAGGAIELVEHLEDVTGLAAERRSWSLVMNRVLNASEQGLDEALKLFQEMRDRSVQISASTVQPLIDALLAEPSPDALASAKTLYEDLSQSSRSYKFGPDLSTYVTLLRACASPAHPDLAFSRSLIADMRERGVKLEGSSVTWHIIALMRAASSFEEAFAAYDQLRALDASVFTQQSYNTILSAFTSLSDKNTAPPRMILEFLSDMRRANCPADSTTYSLLLRYYSRAPSASPSTIAHLHSLIKLDNSLDPDTALFNSLINAYARVGAFGAAYRVFDSLRVNAGPGAGPKLNDRSLAIYLDTCGFDESTEARRRGSEAWRALERGSFVGVERNEKHWSSWVEALCRWQQYDEAEQVAFSDDGRRRGGMGMIETLVKMVQADGEERAERVMNRVREELGERVWDKVKAL